MIILGKSIKTGKRRSFFSARANFGSCELVIRLHHVLLNVNCFQSKCPCVSSGMVHGILIYTDSGRLFNKDEENALLQEQAWQALAPQQFNRCSCCFDFAIYTFGRNLRILRTTHSILYSSGRNHRYLPVAG